jgi:FtsP/CotA-like multicopper oxidase with cupredoxin domain
MIVRIALALTLCFSFFSIPVRGQGAAAVQHTPALHKNPTAEVPKDAPESHELQALRVDTGGPCDYQVLDLNNPSIAGQPFHNPPSLSSKNGALDTQLEVKYTDPGAMKIGGCGVKLRSFNGGLVGPTLRLKPGDVLRLLLVNNLPGESAQELKAEFDDENNLAHIIATPHSFNTTNLHYHGLHVSPSSKIVDGEVVASDDVLIAVAPGTKQGYEVVLPKDHPTGTFWYHPHAHGSTAIQVGSGMAGALIVDDDASVVPKSVQAASRPEHEKIMVFQSILYDRSGEVKNIEGFFPAPTIPTPANCKEQQAEGTWECSHRMTTINGQIIPVITMRPGEVQRWRMIDAGFRESLALQLDDHALHEIALDGIYTGRIDDWTPDTRPLDLEPGYRSDVLVQAKPCTEIVQSHAEQLRLLLKSIQATPVISNVAPNSRAIGPEKCVYGLWNRATAPSQSLRGGQQRENLLAIVEVTGDPVRDMSLPTEAEMATLRASVPLPLDDLSKASPGPSAVQQVVFKLGQDPQGAKNYFQVNYQSFDPSNERKLLLNATEQWSITTVGDPANISGIPSLPHVFHIHVNPFQYTRRDPQNKPELVWKDTLLIPAGNGTNSINVYTTYKDFTGRFVMHCHILDHEDLGMMEVDHVVQDLATPMTVESLEMLHKAQH